MQTTTLLIFALTYLGVAVGHIYSLTINRTGIALLGAIFMVAFGGLTPHGALESVNFSTIMMLYGLMIISGQMWLSGFFNWVAEKIAGQLGRPRRFLFILIFLSGFLSAFLINDVVCLAFAPVIAIAVQRRRLNPVPFLIALAMSANLGAAATPIGNPQNILVANEAGLGFGAYLLWCLPPVVLSLIACFLLISWLARADLKQAPAAVDEPPAPLNKWESGKGLVILAVVVALFFTDLPRSLVMVTAASLLLISQHIHASDLLGKIDWSILTLFAALFIVVGGLQATGLPPQALAYLNRHGIDLHNPFQLSAVTAVLSNLISNAAAVMLLVHILDLKDPVTGYVLCLANSFAGNLILLGSIANLITVEQAGRLGIKISLKQFFKFGVPVTIASYAILALWIVVAKHW